MPERRTLVTGGAGFIGSHLVERLLARGDSVVALDDLSTGRLANLAEAQANPRLSIREGSVLDAALVATLTREADHVYHLAAAVGVDWILRHPLRSLETNIRGTEIVLDACAAGRTPVLVASTSEVYGKNDADALSEDDDRILGAARLSRWFYAAAKSIDESMALAHAQENGLPAVIVRFFNTVGPRQTGRYGMVVPRFVRWALSGEPIAVYGDGRQTRCFTHVADAVTAIVALMDTPSAAGEIFNIGRAEEVGILDLAHRVKALVGSTSEVRLVPYDDAQAYGARAGGYEDMRRRVPNVAKLKRVTGFEPTIPLDQILADVVAFERGRGAARAVSPAAAG